MSRSLTSPLRWPAAALLVVVAAVHVPLVPDHLEEAPYVGVLFLALAVVSVVLAALLVTRDTRLVWAASGLVTLLALLAFVASRTAGLPELGDDVGNWTEPLGFPAVAAEAAVSIIAARTLRRSPQAVHRRG
ncbi:hypothetical protein [Nocardioides panaciterrulae]|uniref:Uncharacterized protein n=1 Tax=Nocardioides panaciterrulae TaxID=661492 RepID=A0A7Y9JCW5_9ACTN|nr:hypothetical protein [Nocardioides panaciterrulae]NYD42669.1 hypothetical protein [Nocardioides panaciterrulae]